MKKQKNLTFKEKNKKNNKFSNKGITLIALIITIIILLILAGVTIMTLTGDNGLLKKAQTGSEETKKSQAAETMNLKITNIQISSYAENHQLPNLQYLADKLCEDNDMEYVLTETKKHASLDKIDVTNISSIYTKLKAYPYEFEINSSLQLASIDGIKIADNDLENNSNNTTTNENYSTEEQVIGTWIDGTTLYQKTIDCGPLPNATTKQISTGLNNIIVRSIDGYCRNPSDNVSLSIPKVSTYETYCSEILSDGNTITIKTRVDASKFSETFITLKYTKINN